MITFFVSAISIGQTNPCTQINSYKIVVLGSSTAAGSGTSTSDSAWVNRYRTYLESINADNEVINLAVGGYNTYKIMPTGFTPPLNRPNPDINKNITMALALNPDAIIVNMPSNDVASGYSYAEQMFNLDSIFQLSNQNNVPIWICTTQPRNFSNSTQLQLQSDLKDSIISIFDPFTIDFWTNLAEPNHTPNPIYDSGDGVHLNDLGHSLLFQRVQNLNILDQLFTPATTNDYGIHSMNLDLVSLCGDSSTNVQVIIANYGISNTFNSQIFIQSENLSNGLIQMDSMLISPIPSCEYDTLIFQINTYLAGNYALESYCKLSQDTTQGNDTLLQTFSTIGHPEIINLFDTLCESGFGMFNINSNILDTSFWYNHFLDSLAIGFGNQFESPYIDSTTTWFAETVRGDLFYRSNITTTTTSSINFNGAMINVVPLNDLILDSIGLKILNTGIQSLDIYYKIGSYIGHENNAVSWSLLTTISANVIDSLAFTNFKIPNLNLLSNDTIGFYFQMSDPQNKLAYQWVSNPITRSNSEIIVITGSGISYNFNNNYFPRDLNCELFYHYGDRPQGECSTGKFPAIAYVSNTEIYFGNDTIIDINDSISYSVPLGVNNWEWQNGSMDSVITINASEYGIGIHYISIGGYDSLGCFISEEIVLAIADLVNLNKQNLINLSIYPNPTSDWLYANNTNVDIIKVYSVDGKLIKVSNEFPLNISELKNGIYLIKVEYKNATQQFRIVKI